MICESCGRNAVMVEVDMGIGPYECHGYRGVHHDWQIVTKCCHSSAIEGSCKLLRIETRTARKDHNSSIKKGDKYIIWTYRSYCAGGGSWYHTFKKLVRSCKTGDSIPELVLT